MRLINFICFFWGLHIALVQAQTAKKSFHAAADLKQNFVKINRNTYACKYETTNADYLRFINDVKYRMNPAVFASLLPDSSRWNDPGIDKPKWARGYLRKPKFALFPVVNISYEQANFYCAWLTKEYEKSSNKPFKKIAFKLPSRSEWQQAVSNGNLAMAYAWGDSVNSRHVKVNDARTQRQQKRNLPVKVNQRAYKQSKNGLYHAAGNVSEMIAGKGDCVGGNYRSNTFFRKIEAPNEFYPSYVPCPLIGFRIFFQVLEE
jgi:formylglycine-generating enzyme required for sulfatase activity